MREGRIRKGREAEGRGIERVEKKEGEGSRGKFGSGIESGGIRR